MGFNLAFRGLTIITTRKKVVENSIGNVHIARL
jgi:hypothetical protein